MLGIAIDVLTADGRRRAQVGGDLPKIISFRVEGAETNPTGFSLAAKSSVTVEAAIDSLSTAIAARLENEMSQILRRSRSLTLELTRAAG